MKANTQPLPEKGRLSLIATRLDLEAAASPDENGSPRRFTMTAYTGGPMKLAGWRHPVVVDLVGLAIGDQNRPILLDHAHDVESVMGQTDKISATDKELLVTGQILGDSPKARQVIALADKGFSWRASIGARAEQVEFVADGAKIKANGQTFTGPIYVARKSTLGEISFVVLAADDNARAQIAATADQPDEAAAGASPANSNNSVPQKNASPFSEWLKAQGFTMDTLSATQKDNLKQLFEKTNKEDRTDSPSATADMDVEARRQTQEAVADFRSTLAAEKERVRAIERICDGRHTEIEARAIADGWDVTRTELEALRAERPSGPAIHTQDDNGLFAEGIEAALCMSPGAIREDQAKELFSERAMEAALGKSLRGAGLHYLMHRVIRAAGMSVKAGMVDNEFIRTAMAADRQLTAAGEFSTISLTGILSNVANKTMLASFEAVDNVLALISAQADANDFKQVTSYRMTGIGEFQKVGPSGELKHGTLGEETFQNQVETYGTLLSLNRQMMINDDLGAFLRLPRIIGRQSAIKLQKVGFSLLLANAGNFFIAAHRNYFDGADSSLQIGSLSVAEQKFFDQTDENGDPISMTPGILLVPTSLKTVADLLYNEVSVNETTTANKPKPARNPHAGKFRPVATPWLNAQSLTGSSPTAWYLLADPADAAVLEVIYLRGRRTPVIESEETAFNTLGMQWRGYFDFGVALQEHRAGVKSKGAT